MLFLSFSSYTLLYLYIYFVWGMLQTFCHSSNVFFLCLCTAESRGIPNIPTLRNTLGQKRRLQKEIKKHTNSVKKYLHKQIATTMPIDNIYNMGNFPLNHFKEGVMNEGLSFVITPNMVTKDEFFKAFLKFKRRIPLHYHFFTRPTNKIKTLPNKFRSG